MIPDDNTDEQPHPIDLIHELRGALGQPVVALPDPPCVVWQQALDDVRWLRTERDQACHERDLLTAALNASNEDLRRLRGVSPND